MSIYLGVGAPDSKRITVIIEVIWSSDPLLEGGLKFGFESSHRFPELFR